MITIYLRKEGLTLAATVNEVIHRHHNMFKVCFQDGYENIFFTDAESGKWVEEDLGFTQLAQEFGKRIKSYMLNSIHVPKVLTWHKQYIYDKLVCFGFFNFMNGLQKFYQLYNANKKYMCTLVDMGNDEWQILGNSEDLDKNLDATFLQHVIQILPLYSVKAK